MMPVAPWVRELVEAEWPCSMEVGIKTLHATDGREVLITSGRFWDTHGVSNWWTWREVLPDGSLGPEECGYGW
jgi:hypothetical protein